MAGAAITAVEVSVADAVVPAVVGVLCMMVIYGLQSANVADPDTNKVLSKEMHRQMLTRIQPASWRCFFHRLSHSDTEEKESWQDRLFLYSARAAGNLLRMNRSSALRKSANGH